MGLNPGYRLKPFLLIFDTLNISNIFIFQKKSGARRNFRPDDRQPGWGQTGM